MAVTITFTARNGNGVTLLNSVTPPTASQAQQTYKQSALVVFGVVADVQALFTHNWGFDVSAAGSFEPEIFMEPISTTTSWPLITFNRVNSNVVSVNKLVSDAATTVIVTLRKPHSIGQ